LQREKVGVFVTRRNLKLWLFACAVFLVVTACHRATESAVDISIEHEVTPQPARAGPAILTLRLRDAAAKPIAGAQVMIEAVMSHPGMAPVFARAKEVEAGRYQAGLEFSMGGDWIVLIHLTLSNGQKLERQFEIRGVQSN
jgi:hypothetical protein